MVLRINSAIALYNVKKSKHKQNNYDQTDYVDNTHNSSAFQINSDGVLDILYVSSHTPPHDTPGVATPDNS